MRQSGPGAFALLLLLLFLLVSACDGDQERLTAGQAAPSFELNRLDGEKVRFPDDYRNQVVAIRFWADWCPYCKDEMKEIEPIFQEYRRRGFRILAINVRQSAETADAFIKKLNISYEVLLDEEGDVAKAYRVSGLPTTVFVGRDGMLRNRIVGEATAETFEHIVTDLLARHPS